MTSAFPPRTRNVPLTCTQLSAAGAGPAHRTAKPTGYASAAQHQIAIRATAKLSSCVNRGIDACPRAEASLIPKPVNSTR